eukprot:9654325-Alexandrium_andersonii.AAC.1
MTNTTWAAGRALQALQEVARAFGMQLNQSTAHASTTNTDRPAQVEKGDMSGVILAPRAALHLEEGTRDKIAEAGLA